MKILFLSLLFVIQSLFISQNRIVLAIDQQDTPATELIGQPDFYTNLNQILGLFSPRSIIGINNKIYVSDWGCARIAIYDPITQNHQAIIATLGQPSTSDCINNNGGVSNHSLYETRGISTDGVHFFVADTSNNRVLIWNSIPTTNAAPADVVVGQPDMSSNTANNGGITAHSLNAPRWVYSDGVRLYISDTANNRVLIWNSIPTTNGKDADIVLGQPDMTHNTANNGGITAHSLNGPNGINKINNKLYIADTTNNRILIFNTEPSTQADANIVLGQPNMTQNTINNGGVSAHSLYYPYNISSNNSNLIITDGFNHRVLIYSTIPSVNQADANYVVGQPDMTTNTENNGGISAHSLGYPKDANIINNQLYIADDFNNRVLIWNTVPSSNQANADLVIGQFRMNENNPISA